MRIVLASASPRRRELLAQIGLEFEVMVSDVEERATAETPQEIVRELARQKAEAVGRMLRAAEKGEQFLVIGADTIVSCGGEILGKPADIMEARRMLRMLSDGSHEVYTGVALLYYRGEDAVCKNFYEETKVRFAPMTEAEIEAYAATGDPLDKAGAYGIQGFCARYITGIEGDYNNVVGLPVCRLYQEAKEWLA